MLDILGSLDKVLAAEFLLASHVIDLIRPTMGDLPMGSGASAMLELIRSRVDPPGDERFYRDDLLAVLDLVQSGEHYGSPRGTPASSRRARRAVRCSRESLGVVADRAYGCPEP